MDYAFKDQLSLITVFSWVCSTAIKCTNSVIFSKELT